MIEYVEVRSASTREIIGIIDNSKSIIWHDVYYGVGDFEIYAPCTQENIDALAVGNYITRYNSRNVGIIEKIEVTYNPQDGRMIVAAGRFAKSILDRRLIFKLSGHSVSPTFLSGNVESAARSLVADNAISCAFDTGRNMPELVLGASAGITKKIIDNDGYSADKQVTYKELLSYSDGLLEEYELGAYCMLDNNLKLAYTVFEGADRSVDNTAGNQPVVFSQDFDNLLSSEYQYDNTKLKNAALIGGEGEGEARFCSIVKDSAVTGLKRREVWIDSSSITKKYNDESGAEQTFTDDEYDKQLKTDGMQKLAELAITETFEGEIDITNGSFSYGTDFALGDKVTVQDTEIGLYINARILEITEVQDDNGYSIEAKYG